MVPDRLHGIMAEFDRADQLLEAARSVRAAGFTRLDAYSPVPIEGLADAIGFRSRVVSKIVLAGGLLGIALGFGLMYWITVIAYPINVSGRPLNSWPAYIPITFECMVLVAAYSALFGMLATNGLPQHYHPVFNIDEFEHASRDAFFLCIEADDPNFDPAATREFLRSTGAKEVFDVPK